MWEHVACAVADDSTVGARSSRSSTRSSRLLPDLAVRRPGRPARDRLGVDPARRHYSGIGGTTPQVLLQDAAARILAGNAERVALVVGAEALATQAAARRRGSATRELPAGGQASVPVGGAVPPGRGRARRVPAWLTFAMFDNARRGHLGVGLAEYRREIAGMMAPMTDIAAANPNAWFPVARGVDDILSRGRRTAWSATRTPSTWSSVMDVDMAAALLRHEPRGSRRLGVPADRRVYLRGWCYATDPVYVAEHPELWRSPAMAAASGEALRVAGVGVDDVAHLDLYSASRSRELRARRARHRPRRPRPLTVTGGLPYHGGPASNYMTPLDRDDGRHAPRGPRRVRAGERGGDAHDEARVRRLLDDPGPVAPPAQARCRPSSSRTRPGRARTTRATRRWPPTRSSTAATAGRRRGRVCDVGRGARTYARVSADLLRSAEEVERGAHGAPHACHGDAADRRRSRRQPRHPRLSSRSWHDTVGIRHQFVPRTGRGGAVSGGGGRGCAGRGCSCSPGWCRRRCVNARM